MSGTSLDPKALRAAVPIVRFLHDRGLTSRLRRQGRRLVGPCPIHGGDNPTAFVVDPGRQLWYCFTACQAGGDVVTLVRRLDRASFPQALRTLAAIAPLPDVPNACAPPPPTPPGRFRPFTRTLPLDPTAPFLGAKRIWPTTATTFEAGLYRGTGFLQDWVAVRLHDIHGHPLGYAGRRLRPADISRYGKWKFPPRLPKSELLFNYHRVQHISRSHGLVLVECPWAVMRLAQLGVPAVALLGTRLFPAHLQRLHRAPRLLIMMDGDPAGAAAARRLRHTLAAHPDVRTTCLPDGLDPDDLTGPELTHAASPLLS